VDGQDTGRGTGKGGELMKPYYEHAGIKTAGAGSVRFSGDAMTDCKVIWNAWARKELVPKLNTVPVSQQRDWDARMEREK